MSDLKNIYFYNKNFECQVRGFIAPKEFLVGQTLRQLEITLGFEPGRLSKGAAFAELVSKPQMNELEYFGDTGTPEHRFESTRNKNMSKEDLSKAAYSYIQPSTKLIKVLPLRDANPLKSLDENWPSGLGSMQYKLKILKPAVVIAVQTDYPNGRFL